MKKTFVLTLLSSVIVASGGAANASVLTFDITPSLNNYDDIPTSYGDNISSTSDGIGSYLVGNGFTPNITVDYRTLNATTGDTVANNLDFWSTGYSDLNNVAFPVANGYLGEISLIPESGYSVTLNSFDLGGWPLRDQPNQTIKILDQAYNVLLDYSPFNVEGNSGHSSFIPKITSTSAIRIQFGPSWDTGIDNINFDQAKANSVPEPSLMLSALSAIGIGSVMKRMKKKLA